MGLLYERTGCLTAKNCGVSARAVPRQAVLVDLRDAHDCAGAVIRYVVTVYNIESLQWCLGAVIMS